jgi:cytochrome c556
MKSRLLLGLALAACPLGAVIAQSAAPAAMSAEEIVRARQAAFGLSAQTFVAMRALVAAPTGDVRPVADAARQLQRWARTLPTMFPEGTNIPPTKALPAVWSERSAFRERAEAYRAAAAALASAAQNNDRQAAQVQWQAVRDSCQACHEHFRAAD